jgi:hypothetical protein
MTRRSSVARRARSAGERHHPALVEEVRVPPPAQRRLLVHAAATVRRRAARPGGYAGLSAAAAHGLCATLDEILADAPELDRVSRTDAVCLAHRVLDDDHPERSDLWPVPRHG